MKPTKEELEKIRICAIIEHEVDKFVWLREDDKGRYIEYAFKEGAPHDNRCLSWYDKPHPKYFEKHPDLRQGKVKNVDELYELEEFCCGRQNKEGDEHCSAGHPKETCDYITVGRKAGEKWRDWTYEEPIKCACWTLSEPSVPKRVLVPIEDVLRLKDQLVG